MKLNTANDLSQADWDFVRKLTKVCAVEVLSHQVCMIFLKGQSSGWGTGTDADNKLVFPENWSLQWVGATLDKHDNVSVKMTWEVLKPKPTTI